jgi:hypothetical protein
MLFVLLIYLKFFFSFFFGGTKVACKAGAPPLEPQLLLLVLIDEKTDA